MKRKTKRMLGVFGLAGVVAMTAIACAIPAPEAHAEDADMTIQVTVVRPGSSLTLDEPKNDTLISSNILEVKYSYQNMAEAKVTVSCTGARAAVEIERLYTIPEDQKTGKRTEQIDLDAEGVKDGSTCRVILSGTPIGGGNGITSEEVEFTYRGISVDIPSTPGGDNEPSKPITDEKGDPEVTIGVSDAVYSLLLQVYDSDHNPVFVLNGVEDPILVSRDKFDLETNTYKLNLPMSKYGAKSGWYELVAIAYGQDGKEVISMNVYRFYYDAGAPNVPGTGTVMDNLNISRADYVVTGLIAFGAVAVFGVYLVARKSRR